MPNDSLTNDIARPVRSSGSQGSGGFSPLHRSAPLFADEIDRQYILVRAGNYLTRSTSEAAILKQGQKESWAWAEAQPDGKVISQKNTIKPPEVEAAWMYRASCDSTLDDIGSGFRASLNIKLSPAILQELEQILLKDKDSAAFQYKFGNPAHTYNSIARHDTITITFFGEPTSETLRELAKFGDRHGRKPSGAEQWDDYLLGENIKVDGKILSGFRVDRSGSVITSHVEPLLELIERLRPELAEGIEIFLKRDSREDQKDWAKMSSGQLNGLQRALANEGVVLNYDSRLAGFSISIPTEGPVAPGEQSSTITLHAGPKRFSSFEQLSNFYYEIYSAEALQAIFLNKLPQEPRPIPEIIKDFKSSIIRSEVSEGKNGFPDNHPLMQELDKLKIEESPNLMLLMEFWDLYKNTLSIEVKSHADELARAAKQGDEVDILAKSLYYSSDFGFGISIDVSDYYSATSRRGGSRLVNHSARDTISDIFTGLALAYQEKIENLKFPDEVVKHATLSSSEVDLTKELMIRARILSVKDFTRPTNYEESAKEFHLSPILPVTQNNLRNHWRPELQLQFYQEIRKQFGSAPHDVIKSDARYEAMCQSYEARHQKSEQW